MGCGTFSFPLVFLQSSMMNSIFKLPRVARQVAAMVLVMAAAVVLAVAVPSAAGQALVVDCTHTHQQIAGLGACGMHWTGGDLYADPKIQKMFVEDLGASMVRFGLPSDVLSKEVASVGAISYKNFVFKDKSARDPLDYVGKVYALNPREMTVIASVWTPPGWMKTNHQAAGGNLQKDKIPFYAEYLAQWVLFMKNVEHTPVYAVSIQNELVFSEPYDSCTYTPDLYRETVLTTAQAFRANGLNTKIFGPEHMTWDTAGDLKFVKPILDDPLGRSIFAAVATHGYVDGIKAAGSAQESAALWNALKPLRVPWWMSETSGTQPDFFGEGVDQQGNPNPGAFDLATQIHNALTYGNASAWVYWCLSGHAKSATDGAAGEALMNGDAPTKKYFVSKQYYHFIRPGALRVDAGPDGENNLQISAYVHARNHTLTVVILNHATTDAKVTLNVKGGPRFSRFETYCTSETQDCEKLADVSVARGTATVTLPAQSVVTLFGAARY
jgi:glucuronoarabinoxylan endo-1,4-beta-xylanase